MSGWFTVEDTIMTSRLKVDGGHIYRCDGAMVFVPDVDLQRYQAHLRDAYKQGYTDGQVDACGQFNKAMDDSAMNKSEISAE